MKDLTRLKLYDDGEIGPISETAKEVHQIRRVAVIGWDVAAAKLREVPEGDNHDKNLKYIWIKSEKIWISKDVCMFSFDGFDEWYITVNNGFDVPPYYDGTPDKIKELVEEKIQKNEITYKTIAVETMDINKFKTGVRAYEMKYATDLNNPIYRMEVELDHFMHTYGDPEKRVNSINKALDRITIDDWHNIGQELTVGRGGDGMFDIWNIKISPLRLLTSLYSIETTDVLKEFVLKSIKKRGVIFSKMKEYNEIVVFLQNALKKGNSATFCHNVLNLIT